MWWILACAAPPEVWSPEGVPAAISGDLHYVSMLDGEVWCDADIAFDGWATCPDCTWSYLIDAEVVAQRGREDCVLDPRYAWVDGWGEDVEPVGIEWGVGAPIEVGYDHLEDCYDYSGPSYGYYTYDAIGNERVDEVLDVARPTFGDDAIRWQVATRPARQPEIPGPWHRDCGDLEERDDRVDFGAAPTETITGAVACGTVDVYRVDGGGALQVEASAVPGFAHPFVWLNDAASGCSVAEDRWMEGPWGEGWGAWCVDESVDVPSQIGRLLPEGPWDLVVAAHPTSCRGGETPYRLVVQAPGAIALLHDDVPRVPRMADEIAIEGSATWTSPVPGD